jgi:uncharacterized membrane protein HdeD (DUF308 family)
LRVRDATQGWMIPAANGLACLGLAGLTVVFPQIALDVTLGLVAIWLILYAALTAALALALWPMPRTRLTLVAWTALNLVLATLAITDRTATIFTLLYVGAGYAVAFGALHVAAGEWIRRIAVPRVAPPVQFGWTAPSR